MKYHVYILKSLKDQGYYTGCTAKIEDRLKRHNEGRVSATSYRRPLKLVYKKDFDSLAGARKRETFIKKQRNRRYIEKLISGAYELK